MADSVMPDFQELAALGVPGAALVQGAINAIAREQQLAGGGHYEFHPDELQTVLNQWKGLQDTITTAMNTVTSRAPHNATVLALGNEHASNTAADAAHATNQAYQEYLKSMQKYVTGYVNKLSGALHNYLQTEDNNAELSRGARGHLA